MPWYLAFLAGIGATLAYFRVHDYVYQRRVIRRLVKMGPPPQPHTTRYTLPGAPPTGSRVRIVDGAWRDCVYERQLIAPDDGVIYGPWGAWKLVDAPDDASVGIRQGYGLPITWAWVLSRGSAAVALPPTDEQRAQEAVYGPVAARWGDPDTPCPFLGMCDVADCTDVHPCELGVGHTGLHESLNKRPLHNPRWASALLNDLDEESTRPNAAVTPQESAQEPCNCGRPSQHRPGCNRYRRVAGFADYPGSP